MNHAVPGFNGERPDPLTETCLPGNGYRAYNPRLMRFHCPDDESPFGPGGLNTYAWCDGDPINRADPSGHHSVGGWLGIGVGVALGLLLTPVSGGSSLAVALSMLSVTSAAASAGLAMAQQCVEASDPHTASRLGWLALGAGIVSGLGSAALSRIAPGATSLASLLKGTSNRPIGGLMMSAGEQRADTPADGQFRYARVIGIYRHAQPPGHHLAFSFHDSVPGGTRFNIYGMPALTSRHQFAVGSGVFGAEGYIEDMIGINRLGRLVNEEMVKSPDIVAVRLVVPFAGAQPGPQTTRFTSQLRSFLKRIYHLHLAVSGPVSSFELTGAAVNELNNLQNALWLSHGQLLDAGGLRFTPNRARQSIEQLSARYGDVAGAFNVEGGQWVVSGRFGAE